MLKFGYTIGATICHVGLGDKQWFGIIPKINLTRQRKSYHDVAMVKQ